MPQLLGAPGKPEITSKPVTQNVCFVGNCACFYCCKPDHLITDYIARKMGNAKSVGFVQTVPIVNKVSNRLSCDNTLDPCGSRGMLKWQFELGQRRRR